MILVDKVFLAIYVVELAMKLYAFRLKFFKEPWNIYGRVQFTQRYVYYVTYSYRFDNCCCKFC